MPTYHRQGPGWRPRNANSSQSLSRRALSTTVLRSPPPAASRSSGHRNKRDGSRLFGRRSRHLMCTGFPTPPLPPSRLPARFLSLHSSSSLSLPYSCSGRSSHRIPSTPLLPLSLPPPPRPPFSGTVAAPQARPSGSSAMASVRCTTVSIIGRFLRDLAIAC